MSVSIHVRCTIHSLYDGGVALARFFPTFTLAITRKPHYTYNTSSFFLLLVTNVNRIDAAMCCLCDVCEGWERELQGDFQPQICETKEIPSRTETKTGLATYKINKKFKLKSNRSTTPSSFSIVFLSTTLQIYFYCRLCWRSSSAPDFKSSFTHTLCIAKHLSSSTFISCWKCILMTYTTRSTLAFR